MKTKPLILAGLFMSVVLAVWSSPAAGQAAGPQPRTRLRERISDLYLLRLTRALELTEDQTARLYPVLTRAEKQKADLQSQMGLDIRALRAELAKTPPEETAVLQLADRIRDARRAIRKVDDAVEAALDQALTSVQRARYLIFTVDFLRRVGENLGRSGAVRGLTKRSP
ncbi:MAG: periplasmic heavy metal sensor [Candidatus Aminicenantes bacterium]|nr:MAG: periplasmic heavy metal sensor [Candidatus Aminicenantes bacterium]